MRRVEIIERVDTSREALDRLLASRGDSWDEPSILQVGTTFRICAEPQDGSLRMTAFYDARVPYFGWVFNIPLRAATKSFLRYRAQTLAAEATGRPAPPEPKRPPWAPPDIWSADQVRTVATVAFLLAIAAFGASLLSQTSDYVAKTFHASNAQLGVLLAVTRIGNLIVLVGGVLADRVGRRRLLLASVVTVVVAATVSGIAPALVTFGTAQIVVNGASNLAFLVGFIAAVEEAPETSRAYTLAIVTVASGIGYALVAILLPFADLRHDAWRGLYLIGGLALLLMPSISRNLVETKRYEALVARDAKRGRIGEVVDKTYGGRFAVLAVTGYLLAFHFAPAAQLTNRYLNDERHFSGFGILLLRAATQSVLGIVAIYVGGRLAESIGRRPIASWGLIGSSVFIAMFFTTSGPALWITLALASTAGSLATPSLSSFGNELFPTEIRGTAGAGLTVIGVMGSASGLLTVGYLSDPLGSLGSAIAVTAVAPLIVAVFLVRYLPEARGKLLDDVSPPEV